MSTPRRVLFLCPDHGIRSHIAATLLGHYGGADFAADSAGVRPQPISSEVLAVMTAIDMEWAQVRSAAVDELRHRTFDHVISICDRNREPCPTWDDDHPVVCWHYPDPATRSDPEELRWAIGLLRSQLAQRVLVFISAQRRTLQHEPASDQQSANQLLGFQPPERV